LTVAPHSPGQVLTASMVTVPKVYSDTALSGTTSGTTELVIGTLVVPAQPVAVRLDVRASVVFTASSLEDFELKVRSTNVSGTVRAVGRDRGTGVSTGISVHAISHAPIAVDANTAHTLVVTLQRLSGSNPGVVAAGTGRQGLSALVMADFT
jgi:hypothetical protein